MMFWVYFTILLSCYVANSSINDESKTSYFLMVAIIVSVSGLFSVILS